jgi:hypothetical protein
MCDKVSSRSSKGNMETCGIKVDFHPQKPSETLRLGVNICGMVCTQTGGTGAKAPAPSSGGGSQCCSVMSEMVSPRL